MRNQPLGSQNNVRKMCRAQLSLFQLHQIRARQAQATKLYAQLIAETNVLSMFELYSEDILRQSHSRGLESEKYVYSTGTV